MSQYGPSHIAPGFGLGDPSFHAVAEDPLPPRWSRHVHPEGDVYFYRPSDSSAASALSVVTDSRITTPETMARLAPAIEWIERCLSQRSPHIALELYVRVEETGGVHYHIAAHSARTIFWLHDQNSEDLCLRPVISNTHLSKIFATVEDSNTHRQF